MSATLAISSQVFSSMMQVEAGERLVHQQEVLAAQDLLNDGAALALAARELRGIEVVLVLQAELREERHHLVAGDARSPSPSAWRPASGCRARCDARRAGSSGRPRPLRRPCTGRSKPLTETRPEVGWCNPAMMRKSVVLPQPEGPRMPDHLPLHPARHDDVAHLGGDVAQHRAAIVLETDVVDLQESLAEAVSGGCH